jgi:hypothetical protein
MTVAIMQPYFIPYAGYFRLFAASDLFVIYDCVQFPRRGWVHRNRLPDASGTDRWLTLPLATAPRDVRIRDLRFSLDARDVLARRMRSMPLFAAERAAEPDIVAALRDVRGAPVDYIERLLHVVVSQLGMKWEVLRSGTLAVPESLRGQERIIEICRRLGATRYVNSPNGRVLYDAPTFDAAGIELRFLSDYRGPFCSIARRLLEEDAAALARDIKSASHAMP